MRGAPIEDEDVTAGRLYGSVPNFFDWHPRVAVGAQFHRAQIDVRVGEVVET